MRLFVLSILFICSAWSFSQSIIQGSVRDSRTHDPLPYCNISVNGTKKGTITNGEGVFSISADLNKDTLLFSYLGYQPQLIPVKKLIQNTTVLLKSQEVLLQEVTVHSTTDFVYEILDKCRHRLMEDQTSRISKVYYGIETQSKEQPIELVECYYNGYMKGPAIDKLMLKNGRIGLAGMDNRYFLTLNSSKAISSINMTKRSEFYPAVPFQLGKREMKKEFVVEIENGDDKIIKIKFQPRKDLNKSFSGEIWIDKKNFALLRIDLSVENTAIHPFLPLFQKDSIHNVDLSVSHTYKQENDKILLDHINFSYHLKYKSVRDSVTVRIPSVITRDITSKGVLYFYDYDKPFILPYFEYASDYDDYRKMSVIPYNEVFWNNNSTLVLTEKQKKDLGFFSHEGYLINFKEGNYGKDFLNLPEYDATFYEYYYTFWSKDKRILLNKKMEQNKEYSLDKISQSIPVNLYNLKTQILLDVTQLEDSLICKSYTVFDANKTFYHLPEQPYTSVFLNIYFDICEIERRRMADLLNSASFTASQVDSVYKLTGKRIDEITNKYQKEVQLGKEEKSLQKWNNYVKENLEIDNCNIFQYKSTNRK
jgi:hypothetical protein